MLKFSSLKDDKLDSYVKHKEAIMNQKLLFLTLAITLLFFSCSSSSKIKGAGPITDPDGEFVSFESIIDPSIFVPETIVRYPSGEIKSGRLIGSYEDPNTTYSYYLYDGTIRYFRDISFYENGRVKRGVVEHVDASTPAEVNGVLYRPGAAISFYPDGLVQAGILARAQEYFGINYRAFSAIYFYQESRLVERGRLAEDQMISNLTFAGDSTIYFYENGFVKQGNLNAPHTIDGITYDVSPLRWCGNSEVTLEAISCAVHNNVISSVFFHSNGQLKQGTLTTNVIIDGNSFYDNSLTFYENGNLHSGYVSGDTNQPVAGGIVRGRRWVSGVGYVDFEEQVGTVGYTATIDEIPIFGGSTRGIVYFWDNGRLKQGRLAADKMFGTNLVEKWFEVRLNPDGSYHSSWIGYDDDNFTAYSQPPSIGEDEATTNN